MDLDKFLQNKKKHMDRPALVETWALLLGFGLYTSTYILARLIWTFKLNN